MDGTTGEGLDRDLDRDLERLAVAQLLQLYDSLNWQNFGNRLKKPGFEVIETSSFYGRWSLGSRTLSISRALLFDHPWSAVTEVLKHEMAHQYVNEVLWVTDESAHGPAFQQVCAGLAIDARASGLPDTATASDAEAKVIERIGRLLKLATSPNQHEAEAATVAARRLMLKHNVDVRGEARRYTFRHLGKPTGRRSVASRILARILGDHFFVEVIWVESYDVRAGKRGTVLEICGTVANLAIAEYVWHYLSNTADELWAAHKRARNIRSNRERLSFITGVMEGFRLKLVRESEVSAQETGLVWVGDADLELYFRRRHPRISSGTRSTATLGPAYSEGRAAGERIVLRRGVEDASVSRGRLLGSGS